jgi:integrase
MEKYPPAQYGERKKHRDCKGSWEARYRDAAGSQKSKCFRAKKEAEAFLDATRTAVRSRTYFDPKRGEITLGAWWEMWWPTAQKGLETNTINRKMWSWKAHIEPVWAGTPLNGLEYMALQSWLTQKVRGIETQRKVIGLLRAMLTAAVRDRRLVLNPAADVVLTAKATPKHPDDVKPPTLAQYELVRANTPSWYWPLLDFAQDTGMRWGEYTGLRRCHVDLDGGYVKVREVVIDDNGVLRRKPIPKNSASLRTVPLTPKALDALLIMIERLDPSPAQTDPDEDGMCPEELLFRGPLAGTSRRRRGELITPDSVLSRNNFRRIWIPAIKGAGIARRVRNRETGRIEWWPRVHDYRHAVATRLHAAGKSEAEVQAFLGQQRGSTVTWLYTHTSDETLASMRDALAGVQQGLRVVGSRKDPTTTTRKVSGSLGATGTDGERPH